MRRILVDYARARGAKKRGGEGARTTLATCFDVAEEGKSDSPVDLLDLDRAINALESEKPALAQVIEMVYFGGMTAEETANVLGRSVHVIQHEIRFARTWLRRKLAAAPPDLH
jgi:RNA polymerase sigma factor (TIGR02999 family)